MEPNLTVGTIKNTFLTSRDRCHNSRNPFTSVLKLEHYK